MATRGKRSRKNPPARKARRPAARKERNRKAAAAAARRTRRSPAKAASRAALRRSAAPVLSRSVRPIPRMTSGWSTLRVVWRPAIAMATLPYRVYRVYRWAEAESSRSALASAPLG